MSSFYHWILYIQLYHAALYVDREDTNPVSITMFCRLYTTVSWQLFIDREDTKPQQYLMFFLYIEVVSNCIMAAHVHR